jgi:hypothetical protein
MTTNQCYQTFTAPYAKKATQGNDTCNWKATTARQISYSDLNATCNISGLIGCISYRVPQAPGVKKFVQIYWNG